MEPFVMASWLLSIVPNPIHLLPSHSTASKGWRTITTYHNISRHVGGMRVPVPPGIRFNRAEQVDAMKRQPRWLLRRCVLASVAAIMRLMLSYVMQS